MKSRFILFRRGDVFYTEDTTTGKQHSLRTKDEAEATTLLHSKNEAHRQPVLNLHIARTYLTATDPEVAKRDWQHVLTTITESKKGSTQIRWRTAANDKAFDRIRRRPIIETTAEELLQVLKAGTVSTNVHLRKMHNYCVGMNWLPWPILPKKQWPVIEYGVKRAITLAEHQAIIGRERNPEWRSFYALLWYVGGGQSDVATLCAENIDWEQRVISYARSKTGAMSHLRFGKDAEAILRFRPTTGPLFPNVALRHEKHRAKEFKRRCVGLGIKGVTLHSYRYAWAERARKAGYPERFAMENLGHNSKAMHAAYAKRAQVTVPALEDYEEKAAAAGAAGTVIVPMQAAVA